MIGKKELVESRNQGRLAGRGQLVNRLPGCLAGMWGWGPGGTTAGLAHANKNAGFLGVFECGAGTSSPLCEMGDNVKERKRIKRGKERPALWQSSENINTVGREGEVPGVHLSTEMLQPHSGKQVRCRFSTLGGEGY